jgi:hypothetical protein
VSVTGNRAAAGADRDPSAKRARPDPVAEDCLKTLRVEAVLP